MVRKGGRHSAYFEHPTQLAAEVESRLELCGLDGLMVEFLFVEDPCDKQWRMEHLANMLRIDPWRAERRINTALKLISGWKRKRQEYKQYRRGRKYRMKSQQAESS